jgi:predicted branched-subunit amino acid permease
MRLKPENRTHGRVSSVRGGFTAASLSLLAYAPVGMLAGVLGTVARGQERLAGAQTTQILQ